MKRMTALAARVLGIAAAMLAGGTASAQTQSLTAESDAFMSAANPTRNYGNAGALAVSSASSPKGALSTLLRFDTLGVRNAFDAHFGINQWQPTSATITLTNAPVPSSAVVPFSPADPGTINVSWLSNDAWLEGLGTPQFFTTDGIAWEDLPALVAGGQASAGSYFYDGASTGSAIHSLTIPPGFANDIRSGFKTTLIFETSDASSLMFGNRFSAPDTDPVLTITAGLIPEPSALGLLPIGVLALRRR